MHLKCGAGMENRHWHGKNLSNSLSLNVAKTKLTDILRLLSVSWLSPKIRLQLGVTIHLRSILCILCIVNLNIRSAIGQVTSKETCLRELLLQI